MDKQKARTLNRLNELGLDIEKKIKGLSIRDMLVISGITISEINIITDLQDAIKDSRVIAFLCGGTDEVKCERKGAVNGTEETETGGGKSEIYKY